jgi:hypothetical protein
VIRVGVSEPKPQEPTNARFAVTGLPMRAVRGHVFQPIHVGLVGIVNTMAERASNMDHRSKIGAWAYFHTAMGPGLCGLRTTTPS